jgi:hypothetical protein
MIALRAGLVSSPIRESTCLLPLAPYQCMLSPPTPRRGSSVGAAAYPDGFQAVGSRCGAVFVSESAK